MFLRIIVVFVFSLNVSHNILLYIRNYDKKNKRKKLAEKSKIKRHDSEIEKRNLKWNRIITRSKNKI